FREVVMPGFLKRGVAGLATAALSLSVWVGLMLLVGVGAGVERAAAQVRTVGSIAGTVTDPDGAVVPGATGKLRAEGTNIARETISNDQGGFRFVDLQAGSYEITVTLGGFQATVYKNVAVESARTTDVSVRLQSGQISEVVEVTGAAPTLSVTTNTLS